MVEPSLSAMFGRLKDGSAGVEEESFGDLIPFSNALVKGSFR